VNRVLSESRDRKWHSPKGFYWLSEQNKKKKKKTKKKNKKWLGISILFFAVLLLPQVNPSRHVNLPKPLSSSFS
jgi:hypothetical protein